MCGTIVDFLATPHLQVAGVSWLEKKAAAALFGSPPESSYEEALESLMKVFLPSSLYTSLFHNLCTMQAEERSSEDWKTNALYIAKVSHTHTSHTLWLLTWNIQMTII